MLFEDLKKKANELAQQAATIAQAGANRSRQFAAVAKLKAANLSEEDVIRKAYTELGKLYFAKYGEHADDEFVAVCATIIEAQAAIAANNALVEELTKKPEADEGAQETAEETTTEQAPAEDTAEKVVEAVEEAAADVTETVEKVADAVEETAEKAADAVEETAEKVVETVETVVTETVEEAPEKTTAEEEEKKAE